MVSLGTLHKRAILPSIGDHGCKLIERDRVPAKGRGYWLMCCLCGLTLAQFARIVEGMAQGVNAYGNVVG